MALIEKIHRRVVDMGLVPKIIALLPVFSVLCTVIGMGWLALLPMEGRYRRTYISENALMPSQAYSYFRESEWNVLRGYRSQIEGFKNITHSERNELMSTWLQEFGTKTAIYHDEQHGDTLYGILHAPRGDGTEAMLLTVPWSNTDGMLNVGAASLAVALGRFFSRWPVWSKNIIIVFSENPDASLRSWVEAYHTSLDLTGGSIEAAVVLDYPGSNDFFEYIEVHYEGLNGELPNLDMVNIAVSIIEHEGMKVSLHGLPSAEIANDTFWTRLKILILGTKNAALSGLKKVHGNEAFSGWRIQSVTLRAHGKEGPYDITTFGRVPEAMFRSINNLLEKFHQSFFFYILLAPRYFVSISSYLPSAVALSISFTIASVNSYINNQYTALPLFSRYNLFSLLGWFIAMISSFAVAQIFLLVRLPLLLLSLSFLVSLSPLYLGDFLPIKEPLSYRFRSVAFLYFSLVLTSLLMLNFFLAFVMGLLAFPMTFVNTPLAGIANTRLKVKNSLILAFSNPFISIWLFSILFESDLRGLEIFSKLASAWKDLNCWTWFVICIGWLPTWILVLFSALNNQKPHYTDISKKEQ